MKKVKIALLLILLLSLNGCQNIELVQTSKAITEDKFINLMHIDGGEIKAKDNIRFGTITESFVSERYVVSWNADKSYEMYFIEFKTNENAEYAFKDIVKNKHTLKHDFVKPLEIFENLLPISSVFMGEDNFSEKGWSINKQIIRIILHENIVLIYLARVEYEDTSKDVFGLLGY